MVYNSAADPTAEKRGDKDQTMWQTPFYDNFKRERSIIPYRPISATVIYFKDKDNHSSRNLIRH